MRYAEEIDLVEEEMRRVLQFLRWRRDWWEARAELRIQVDGAFQEGQAAYARKQAGYMHGLGERSSSCGDTSRRSSEWHARDTRP
jgi:hypothetical protein